MPVGKRMSKKKQGKKSGYILFETVLALIAFGMLSVAFFTIFSGQFSMINASRDALQAQQYAQVEAEMLRITEYENLTSKAKSRSAMTSWSNPGNIWESAISFDSEVDTSVGKTRIAHVSVYRQGDTLPRFSLDVPLSSQVGAAYVRNENYPTNAQISMYYDGKRLHTYYKPYGGEKKEVDNVVVGTVSAFVGNLSDIPDGWHVCDGTNGTMDLRGVFLRGYGTQGEYSSDAVGTLQGDAARRAQSGSAYMAANGSAAQANSMFPGTLFSKQTETSSGPRHNFVYKYPNHQPFYTYRYQLQSSGGEIPTYSLVETREDYAFSDDGGGSYTHINQVFDTSLVWPTANEFRPANKAVYFIQKVG